MDAILLIAVYKETKVVRWKMSSDIANKLSDQTRSLVGKFESRVAQFSEREDLLGIMHKLDGDDADSMAREFFGEGEHTATGVDGSMDYDERMQMMLFYSNATAYSCPFRVGSKLSFDMKDAARSAKLSVSSAVPLWAEDISDVIDENFDVELELELEHSVDRIPNAFMTVAEMYLAIKSCDTSKILFLDRPLSGTYASLARDVRLLVRRHRSNLSKLVGRSNDETLLDVSLSLNIGTPSMELPRRERFLQSRILRELMEGAMRVEELSGRLEVQESAIRKSIKALRKTDERYGGLLFDGAGGATIKLNEDVNGYWDRASSLAMAYCEGAYERASSPLSVGPEEWLTVLDINTVAFLLMQRLRDLAVERKILVIGIAKDTTATDISRSVLPFAVKSGMIEVRRTPPRLKNDKAFLSILSAENRGVRPPWRTLGYDSSFSTIFCQSPMGDSEFRSARKYVSREGLFVRGFFQSRSMGRDGRVRSPVFLFDRIFDDRYDSDSVRQLEVTEKYSSVTVKPYCEGTQNSRKSNLVLKVLSLTDNPEVYEAFGHNQLLYLADKAVKVEIRMMKSSLRGVADLRIGGMSKREQVYGIATTYRQQRSEAEAARMKAAGKS
jgi:hypothetical protein